MRIVRYNYPSYRAPAVFSNGLARAPWAFADAELSRLFSETFGDLASPSFPVTVYEDDAKVYVRAELPGVQRADLGVELVQDSLHLTATRKTPAQGDKAEETVALQRSVTLPTEVQPDQVTAAYENGVLTVTLAKREEVKPKKIAITVG